MVAFQGIAPVTVEHDNCKKAGDYKLHPEDSFQRSFEQKFVHFQPSPQSFWIHVFSLGLVFFGALPSSGRGPFSGSLTSTTKPLL